MIDAPMIACERQQVIVDGTAAGSTRAIEEAGACSASTSSSTS